MNKLILIGTIFLLSFQIVFGQNEKNVKGGILNGKAIKMPKPDYPQKAKDFCVGGKVEVEVLVSETGDVLEAEAISGDELLRGVSVTAAKKTKFNQTPHLIAKISGILIYNFDPFVKCVRKKSSDTNKIGFISDLKPKVDLKKPLFPTNCRCKFSKNLKTVVEFVVNENGFVESAKGIAGHPLLRAVSEAAILNSKFTPSLVDNEKVKSFGMIVYDFKLRKKNWETRIIKYELKLERE